MNIETPEKIAIDNLISWIKTKPSWVEYAFRYVNIKDELANDDYNKIFTVCKSQNPEVLEGEQQAFQSPGQHMEVVNLLCIKDVVNVNALACKQNLKFNSDKLIIIYGDNGAGKSGYVRILKKLCQAKCIDDILGNIYSHKFDPKSVSLEFSINGKKSLYRWGDGSDIPSNLYAVSIFDSKCAKIHVDKENSIAFTPYPLELLGRLSKCVKVINEMITSEVNSIELQTPDIIKNPSIDESTEAFKALKDINRLTLEKLNELARFDANDQKSLDDVEEDIKSEPSKQLQKLTLKKDKLARLVKLINKINALLSEKEVNEVIACVTSLREKEAASSLAAKKLEEISLLPNVGAEVWKQLWRQAKKYSEELAYRGESFPVTKGDSKCVLCQQELNESAKIRMNSFDNFVKSKLESEILKLKEVLKQNIDEYSEQYSNLSITLIINCLEVELDELDIAKVLKKEFVQAKWDLRKILKKIKSGVTIVPGDFFIQTSLLNDKVKNIEQRISSLQLTDPAKIRVELNTKRIALEAQKWLNEHFDDISLEIERRNKIAKLKKMKFNTKSITDKSTEISGELITNALSGEFVREIDKFKLASLAIDIKQERAESGVPYFKIKLKDMPAIEIGNILSEGEHRCVALAIFLAELRCSKNQSAIILDDPVSSLDHKHRDLIAKRLVNESANRQVILFTHDLSFLFSLVELYKQKYKDEPIIRGVARNDSETGLCNNEPPLKAQSVVSRITGLKAHINNVSRYYKKGDSASWERETKSICEDLREIWESAVEKTLSPAIKRFSNKLETRGIFKISVLTKDDCEKMREAYGWCSKNCHKTPEAHNVIPPAPGELLTKVDEIKEWLENIEQRQGEMNKY